MKNYVILSTFFYMTSLSMFIFSQNLDDLVLEPGFKISIYADKLDSPRQMA